MKTPFGFLLVIAVGCGASHELGKQAPLQPDGGGGDALGTERGDVDGRSCHADLAMSSCPATWEQAETVPCTAGGLAYHEGLGHAGGYLALGNTATGFGGAACYYDPVTHALVGAWAESDFFEYCDHTSFDVLYGAVDQGLNIKSDIDAVCTSDGGTSDGPPVP
jgi:hypothetical protein